MRRLVRSPLLCLGIATISLSCLVVFLVDGKEQPVLGKGPGKGNVFDESQYLFAKADQNLPHIDLNIISSSILEPVAPPFLVKGKVLASYGFETSKEIAEYIVKQGETLNSIAENFKISLETVLWANNLTAKSSLKVGQKLVILPVSGIMHLVSEGDTLSGISAIYKAKVADIVEFNGLEDEGKIYAGDFLIVPGGIKPKVVAQYVKVPLSKSYFIAPIPSPAKITQGLHWFNAVDFGNGNCGEPVYAAAGGTVQRTGYTNLGGWYVRLLHPNGVVTYYGHLSKVTAIAGGTVYQGQVIGYVGYSGKTVPAGPAGCHLHFDVRFAQNPFAGYKIGDIIGK